MPRFSLPEHLARELRPERVRILAGEDTPAPGGVSIEGGELVVRCEPAESRGVALLLDLDALLEGRAEVPSGPHALRTCMLPPREKPYRLVLELARRRMMLMLNKLEEWSLFDADGEVEDLALRARSAFTRALVASGGPTPDEGRAAEAALDALAATFESSRAVALLQGRSTIPGRLSGELHASAVERYERAQQEPAPPGAPVLLAGATGVILPGRPLIGCEVDPRVFSEGLARVVGASCDFLTTPMRWRDLEPKEGTYSFAPTDRWIEWAVRTAKMPVAAGPLIDFRPERTPEWLEIWENDHDTLRELVAEHVKQVVTRYRRTVRRWSVVSGLAVNRHFSMEFEKMIDLTRIAVAIVRRLHPQANIVIEVDQPWGEYCAEVPGSIPPLVFAEMTQQANIAVDGFGLRLLAGQAGGGWRNDPMELSAMLDRYAVCLERPLLITALGSPSDDAEQRWDERTQQDWLEESLAVILAKPYIHSVCWQSLYDAEGQASAGLISRAGSAKPVARRLGEIRGALREGRSPWSAPVPSVR